MSKSLKKLSLQKIIQCMFIFIFLVSIHRFSSYKYQLCYILMCLSFSLWIVFIIAGCKIIEKLKKIFFILGSIEIALLLLTIAIHYLSGYMYAPVPDTSDTTFFQDKNVMIIVPHEDDDINLMGGVIENYIKGGSEVRVVFATNGDYYGIGELRLEEAIDVLMEMGLAEENIIFLGYGDQWQPVHLPDGSDVKHIYNSTGNFVCTSYNSKKKTYGLQNHLPYHESEYTRENFLKDMEDVILEYRPEIIYANDYDIHIDHRAVSLLFEEAIGIILAETEGYTPVIYKGYCYETAWNAVEDFGEINLVSTLENDVILSSMYQWEKRIRIPVDTSAASRLMSQSSVYKALNGYMSQRASQRAGRIINGDKVFWKRRTDSILYSANITLNNSPVPQLTDFKLIDSGDISEKENIVPENGVLVLADNDVVDVVLCECSDIEEIWLYDNPNRNSNILRGSIIFDTGDSINFGALEAAGNMTKIKCNVRNVKSFKIAIYETEGVAAGLTEIEAYQNVWEDEIDEYVKITDDKGNFCYDYWLEDDCEQAFSIYSLYGNTDLNDYTLELQGTDEGYYELEDNYIYVYCPRGETCILTIKNGNVSDTIKISNPSRLEKLFFLCIRKFDYRYATYQNYFTKTYDYYRRMYIDLLQRIL